MMTEAEIAGYMNWRGPGAYTAATMKRVQAAIAEAVRREREACALMFEKEASEWEAHGNKTHERNDVIMSQARCDELRDMAEAIRQRSNAELTGVAKRSPS
jgi:hypothetical protein